MAVDDVLPAVTMIHLAPLVFVAKETCARMRYVPAPCATFATVFHVADVSEVDEPVPDFICVRYPLESISVSVALGVSLPLYRLATMLPAVLLAPAPISTSVLDAVVPVTRSHPWSLAVAGFVKAMPFLNIAEPGWLR